MELAISYTEGGRVLESLMHSLCDPNAIHYALLHAAVDTERCGCSMKVEQSIDRRVGLGLRSMRGALVSIPKRIWGLKSNVKGLLEAFPLKPVLHGHKLS